MSGKPRSPRIRTRSDAQRSANRDIFAVEEEEKEEGSGEDDSLVIASNLKAFADQENSSPAEADTVLMAAISG